MLRSIVIIVTVVAVVIIRCWDLQEVSIFGSGLNVIFGKGGIS